MEGGGTYGKVGQADAGLQPQSPDGAGVEHLPGERVPLCGEERHVAVGRRDGQHRGAGWGRGRGGGKER